MHIITMAMQNSHNVASPFTNRNRNELERRLNLPQDANINERQIFSTTIQYSSIYYRVACIVLTFLVVQTWHVIQTRHRMQHHRDQLSTFLIDHKVFVNNNDNILSKVDQFMDEQECYSLVSCADRLIRAGAPATQQSSGHAPQWSFEHVTVRQSRKDIEPDASSSDRQVSSWSHNNVDLTSLATAALQLKERFILDQWLRANSIPVWICTRLQQESVNSVARLVYLLTTTTITTTTTNDNNNQHSDKDTKNSDDLLSTTLEPQLQQHLRHQLNIPEQFSDNDLFEQFVRPLRVALWTACLQEDQRHCWTLGSAIITALVPLAVIEAVRMISNFNLPNKEGKCGFLTFITGSYLAPQNCKVIFDWKSPTTVASTVSFSIKFYQRNYKPYPITPEDQLSVHITNAAQVVPCSIEFGDLNPSLANVARVSFSAKKSGNYTINILVGSTFAHIRGSPFKDIYFKPLSPSPFETGFVNHCSTVICTMQNFHALIVEMRDRFGNLCKLDDNEENNGEQFEASEHFSVTITEIVSDRQIDTCYYWQMQPGDSSRIALLISLQSSGIYHAMVSYRGSLLKNGDFNIVCLTDAETEIVRKSTSQSSCSFNAKLLPFSGYSFGGNVSSPVSKPKNVYCYISPKQLTIKEFILKIIPKRIATFRLSPLTKFYFVRDHDGLSGSSSLASLANSTDYEAASISSFQRCPNQDQFLIIGDGSQMPIELLSSDRNIIVAVFTHFLLNKIGGSETFHDKQDFFYSEVRRYHAKNNHQPPRVRLMIQRDNLLESSMKATKSLNVSDWVKRFEIEFVGENGIDWGGLRKEWFELLCKALFEPANHLDLASAPFMRFKHDRQGLIHPNPNTTAKLSYFEFAGKIVGKSLLDTAFRSSTKCLVNARFTRSFLAQLIGLRVNYRYFEKDDPDLYVSKIKFILENDVSELDLHFNEEEYDQKTGKLVRTFDLIPNGSNTRVTEENKVRYLDALALYRLSISVKDQVDAFLKGLNDLIPDHLLSIFDENELELLICGAATYSVSDLRLNHIITGPVYDFQKVVDWFWRSLTNFTEEEFARLLQFTTGCSHLPPGGFADLNPRFQISSSLNYGSLPTAHTCFNQICLPDYECFEDFDRSLRIAITEGNEGFGLV